VQLGNYGRGTRRCRAARTGPSLPGAGGDQGATVRRPGPGEVSAGPLDVVLEADHRSARGRRLDVLVRQAIVAGGEDGSRSQRDGAPARGVIPCVDAFQDQHTNALEHAARRDSSLQRLLCRPVRPVPRSGQTGRRRQNGDEVYER